MSHNNSPWIKELARTRPVVSLDRDLKTDVAVVGGGIAGVVTAFFTLRDTDKSVVLLEAGKIAHGATGHNAGQITSYFERPLPDMVREFGEELAIDGQRSIESAWELLDLIIEEASLPVKYYKFTGYAGLTTLIKLIPHLQSCQHRIRHNLFQEKILIAREWEDHLNIPTEYKGVYSVVPQSEILELLESNNTDYIASLSYQKGCMNSALFTEKLIKYLSEKYGDRFVFYEGSPVKTVTLKKKVGILDVLSHKVEAEKIVLCTNGFEHFTINNEVGMQINTKFHHLVTGLVGYMSGYVQKTKHDPVAISYFPKEKMNNRSVLNESYYYLTRRPYEHDVDMLHDLICVGGPDKVLSEGERFEYDQKAIVGVNITIDQFLKKSYNKYPQDDVEFVYTWQGLMGYTPNGIRRIGPEPCNPVLLYNLGCNGVGILPSIFGGRRIARYLNNEDVEPSIFDPQDHREGKD